MILFIDRGILSIHVHFNKIKSCKKIKKKFAETSMYKEEFRLRLTKYTLNILIFYDLQ